MDLVADHELIKTRLRFTTCAAHARNPSSLLPQLRLEKEKEKERLLLQRPMTRFPPKRLKPEKLRSWLPKGRPAGWAASARGAGGLLGRQIRSINCCAVSPCTLLKCLINSFLSMTLCGQLCPLRFPTMLPDPKLGACSAQPHPAASGGRGLLTGWGARACCPGPSPRCWP